MPAPQIRDAVPEDAPALVPLLAALGYPADASTVRARLGQLLSLDGTGRVLVAVLGPDVVGFATLHSTPTLHRATPVGRITGIAVDGRGRGLGVGRLLVEAAERHFAGLGLARIEVTSGPTHEAAYGFYRHLGYVDQGLRFGKVLLQGGG
jgi:ribosomal protein S18 acetylase RimI-like enzyme